MQGEEVSIEELASNLATYKDQLHQVVFILFIYFFTIKFVSCFRVFQFLVELGFLFCFCFIVNYFAINFLGMVK